MSESGFIKVIILPKECRKSFRKVCGNNRFLWFGAEGCDYCYVSGAEDLKSEMWKSWRFKRTKNNKVIECWRYFKGDTRNRKKAFEFVM